MRATIDDRAFNERASRVGRAGPREDEHGNPPLPVRPDYSGPRHVLWQSLHPEPQDAGCFGS